MGALTDHRKRHRVVVLDVSPVAPSTTVAAARNTPAKKLKLSNLVSSYNISPQPPPPQQHSTLRRLPPAPPLPRPLHGPQRAIKAFGLGTIGRAQASRKAIFDMGNRFSAFFRDNKTSSFSGWKVQEAPEDSRECNHETLGLDKYNNWAVRTHDGYSTERSFSLAHSDLTVATHEHEKAMHFMSRKVEDARKTVLESLSVKPFYKELYEKTKRHDARLSSLDFEIKLTEASRPPQKKQKEDLHEPFSPLTREEENEVLYALNGGSSRNLLVRHVESNIEITREVLQCLSSGAWLNDEVINLYLELLKEREKREPKRFLKCHFFNTFFYKKLTSGQDRYDYKAVRRWTSQKKLGYALIDCDKIFVPVHKENHWCLTVIDVRNESFQYLDSFGGTDSFVLSVLARYLTDEAKDKSGRQIDISSWKEETVNNLPRQKNGWDCGMFMLKYTDFYSRGLSLCFNQAHMKYFRMRTIKEILRLRAD